jgi:RNA polymerase sigma-70 factor (ECF subfamily)
MTAVREGDVSRLGVLFERHHRALFTFFVRLTSDRSGSEDLVQDVFFRMLRYRATYQPGTQFRAWMFQMARNAHIDRYKSRRHEAPVSADDLGELAGHGPAPGDALERRQQLDLLKAALERLPDDKREVIVLSRFSGLDYAQIAQILGCEVGALKVRVHRAVKALRDLFLEMSGERGLRASPR